MPVAIVMFPETNIPAVLHEECEKDLLNLLGELFDASAPLEVEAARLWLLSMPAPSGWFPNVHAARYHIETWVRECAEEEAANAAR